MVRRGIKHKRQIQIALITGVLLLAGVAGIVTARQLKNRSQNFSSLQDSNSTLQKMLQKSPVNPTVRLADTSKPYPTNTWFSGLVFSSVDVPVFAYPLSYKPTPTGFEIGYSVPTSSGNTVAAPHVADLTLDYQTAVKWQVHTYDDLSVTTGHHAGSVRLTQGSPFIFGKLSKGQQAIVRGKSEAKAIHSNSVIYKEGDKTYGITSEASLNVAGGEVRISASQNEANFAVFIIPPGANQQEYLTAATAPITNTSVQYKVRNGEINTEYELRTTTGAATIWGSLAQQQISAQTSKGQLVTLAGPQTFYAGNHFRGTQKLDEPTAELDVTRLSETQKKTLIEQLRQDINNTTITKQDTYFASKELYRLANLLQLASQLGQGDLANQAKSKLQTELVQWLDPNGYKQRPTKYFYYDTAFKGIVGTEPAFESEKFNDHHFHYGYMIYAAAILSAHDTAFRDSHRDMINLLVRDIASPAADQYFPKLRGFDQYMGHSWASGYSAFADGNNQESSSEAVLAWAGVHAWAKANNDQRLQGLANWLYARETSAAKTQWLSIDRTQPQYKNYTHPFVAMVWGGKLDYATWFSA
jgi:endo-1,3(4)-beta-glucanase